MRSIIYWHPKIYEITIKLLYMKNFQERYKAISDIIPIGASVTEVCMGDCYLYRKYLIKKNVKYIGLDINPIFVKYAQKKGIHAKIHNLITDSVPKADYIVLQGSLYQFIQNEHEILKKLFKAAKKKIIISEPVLNVSSSKNYIASALAKMLSNTMTSYGAKRFDRESFIIFLKNYKKNLEKIIEIKGGRDLIGVFKVG